MSSSYAARSRSSARQAPRTNRRFALRLVTPVRQRARRAPFVVIVLAVVSTGLVGLVLVSTVLQAQAFEIATLRSEARDLATTEQKLDGEVERLQNPANLASEAVSMGMVPNQNPAFLRLADGSIVGNPEPAQPGTNVRRVDR